jgi:hypothetical protein
VERDGLRVGEGMYDTPVPVDLGQHTVRVSAPGKKAIELQVEAKQEGVEVVVEIPALATEAPAPPDRSQPPPPPVDPPKPPPPASPARRIAGFAVGGAGVVSLGVGIGLGALALSKKSASNQAGFCNASDVCTAAGQQLRLGGIQAANASTALFVIGGAALGTGIVLLATAPTNQPPSRSGTLRGSQTPPWFDPELSVGLGGATLRARF